MTVPELADIHDFKAQTLQQAMLQVPTLHRRKLEMRHFFSVTSMDPPRIYVCRDGYYKTGGQRLVSEEQLRLIGVQNRSAFVVANSHSENMKRFMGPMQDLEEELSRQGLDVEDVETQIAEKIVRAFLAVADQTSCKNAEHPYHCEGYVAFGITDSSVDMTTKEAYLFEIMLVQEDWVFRGMSWGLAGVNANDVVRASLEKLARISLSRLRPEVSGINRTKWPTDLSDRAARLLADVQNREVVRNMLIEAEQAKGTQCACPICEDTAKFVDFFPNKAETTSFGHPWLAFYELYRAAQAAGGSNQNRRWS